MSAQIAAAEEIVRADIGQLGDFRDQYQRELNGVVVHEGGVSHGRFELLLIRQAERAIGYSVVARGDSTASLLEFFLTPSYRARTTPILDRLLE